MKVVGLVVEYNPFHLGHQYHLETAKRVTSSDGVICVMSGNFIQRGEPAIFDKWARAKMAILGGADLVIELPVVYAMSSAEYFAKAGVALLIGTGIVDSLCFGSESGSIDELKAVAEVLTNEPDEYRGMLKKYLDIGISYPAAREKALIDYFKFADLDCGNLSEYISKANNILGIEYLKALISMNSKIKPITIKRKGSDYTDINLSGSFSSATSIREIVQKDGLSSAVLSTIPESTYKVISEEVENGRGPIFTNYYDNIVLALLRRIGREGLADFPYLGEGLHNRLFKGLLESSTINELVDKTCTKRYTRTRVLRGIMHSLTGLREEDFNVFNNLGGPKYIRILGFNSRGQQMLSKMKEKATLPIIIKTADYAKLLDKTERKMFEIESASTDMYVLGYPAANKGIGQEFTRNVIRIGL